MTHSGFTHSDIPGSKLVDSSPRLIAVFHVLLRYHTSRHSLCALEYLFMHWLTNDWYIPIVPSILHVSALGANRDK